MYKTIEDFLNKKKQITEGRKPSAPKKREPAAKPVTESASNNDHLGDVIKKLSLCHFILAKGINESTTLESVNAAVKDEFELDNYFATDDEFNNFYVKTMEETAAFLQNEGWLDKVKNAVTGAKVFDLSTYSGTDAGKKELANPGRKKSLETIKRGFRNMGMADEFLDKALLAIFDFNGGSAPIINSYNFVWDAEKKSLKIDPNGGGLFNGNPISFS